VRRAARSQIGGTTLAARPHQLKLGVAKAKYSPHKQLCNIVIVDAYRYLVLPWHFHFAEVRGQVLDRKAVNGRLAKVEKQAICIDYERKWLLVSAVVPEGAHDALRTWYAPVTWQILRYAY
jgi:hypothetical protein